MTQVELYNKIKEVDSRIDRVVEEIEASWDGKTISSILFNTYSMLRSFGKKLLECYYEKYHTYIKTNYLDH